MTVKTKKLVNEALALSPIERATLAEAILMSLDRPDPNIDALWKVEVENRLEAFKTGKIKAIPVSRVLSSYRKKKAAF